MRAFRTSLLALGLLSSSVLVYACVGDSPVVPGAPADAGAGTGSDGAPGTPGTNPGSDSGSESPDSGNGATCDGGITCDTVCVDTSSDSKNCGRCAHDCGAGKCNAGVCQPSLVTGSPDGGATITSITTDQGDDNPKAVAQHVYWTQPGVGGGVFQDNVTGGNQITLSTAAPATKSNVVVDTTTAFWFGQNFGGPPQPVLKGQLNTAASQTPIASMNANFLQSILYDAANQNVLGTYAASGSTHGAFKCTTGASPACTSLITFSGQPGGNVVSDLTNIYFCDPGDGLILKSTLNGGNVGTYIGTQATPNALRIDGTTLYWSNSGTKTIQSGPLAGATTGKQITSTTNAADAIAADAVNVYWTDSVTGTVSYAPITGAGPATPYVTLGVGAAPMQLVRDSAFLYYSYNGAIYRVALP